MNYLICALAVYKLVQIADALSPREAMPWVKVIFGVALAYGSTFILHFPDRWITGLAIASLAGFCAALSAGLALSFRRTAEETREGRAFLAGVLHGEADLLNRDRGA